MQPIPQTAAEALAIYMDPVSEDWERDYAAKMIGSLEAGRKALLATARDPNEDGMLQRRAAEVLCWVWRDQGTLMTADISGFTPAALRDILIQRREGPSYRS